MNFLKKFGTILAKIAMVAGDVATGIPLFNTMFPTQSAGTVVQRVESDFTRIAGIITTAEAMIGSISPANAKTGPQKLIAASPFVDKIIQQWIASGVFGTKSKVIDPNKYQAAIVGITSNFADLLNSLGE